MNILIIDAQGGGIGRQLVAAIRERLPEASLTAVGTNSAATSAMLKAGATQAATGENAVVVSSRRADVIIGPIGIVIADALLGEITPRMAQAVAQADAKRILIPINHCDNIVVGVSDLNIRHLLEEVLAELEMIAHLQKQATIFHSSTNEPYAMKAHIVSEQTACAFFAEEEP